MPILTVSALVKEVTRDEALATLLETLQGFGFQTSSWQTGSVQRSIVEMSATIWSQLSGTIASVAAGGFNALATGEALTQFSDSVYDNQRIGASQTQGEMVLAESGVGGPYVFAVGDVVTVDAASGQTFRNTTGGALPVSGTLTLDFAAETAGSAGNIDTSIPISLQTTIAGVTVTNPPVGTTSVWITAYGLDQESDVTLRIRNRSKWPNQSQAKPEDALIFLALEATDPSGVPAGITKASVNSNNPQGPGSVDVFIANDASTATAQQVTDVDTYMQARRATSSILRVLAAPDVGITIDGTVFYPSGASEDQVGAGVQDAVAKLFLDLPLGGSPYQTGATGLSFSELVGAITSVDNVLNVNLTFPTGNISLGGTNSLMFLAGDVWNASGTGSLAFTPI